LEIPKMVFKGNSLVVLAEKKKKGWTHFGLLVASDEKP